MRSSFDIVEQAEVDSKKNEFEVLETEDYDFEMKNFMERFGQLNFDELCLGDEFTTGEEQW